MLNFSFTLADQFFSLTVLFSYKRVKVLRRMYFGLPSMMQIHRNFVKIFRHYRRDGLMPVASEGSFIVEKIRKHKYERHLRSAYSCMRTFSNLLGISWNVFTVYETIDNEIKSSYG
ncbi:DUF4365 domain-containing protein [Pantoea sp. S62]|nr:DUF4365 domain-containing protein [Pantoea sp. S62]